MTQTPRFLLLTLIFLSLLAPCCLAGVKIGIVSDASFADAAAVLTAELSKESGTYELLERDAMEHALAEQGIARSGATAGDWTKVGHLLTADGLVLLQKRKTGENETVNIGWVLSVNTGIVLGAEVLSSDEKKQAQVLMELLQRCRSKMEVKQLDAVPVSVVPAEATDYKFGGDNREIFQNGLMLTLMRDPAIFVLQREQLDSVLFERDFAGAEKQGFWAGANVVQSTVGPDPLNKQVLVASLSLKRRDGSTENWVEKASSPQELCTAAAASIRDRLKLSSNTPAYDTQKEVAYFRQKLKRLLPEYYNTGPLITDTAVTLLALGDKSPVTEQIAALAPVVKVCGTYYPGKVLGKFHKGQLQDRKAALVAMRETMALEHARQRKMIGTFPNKLARSEVTDPNVLSEELDLAATLLLISTSPEDPGLKPEMAALRLQVLDYLKLTSDAKWYSPSAFLLTHGEYFFKDPNAWLDRIETVFRPPFPDNPLLFSSLWLWYSNLQIPRTQDQTLYTPNFYGEYAESDPKTLAAVLPRLKQWAYGTEPGLRIAGARVLCREREAKESNVDRAEMARILVKAMDEVMPLYCRTKAPRDPFGFFNHTNGGGMIFNIRQWLEGVQPLAHKELLDLTIHTLEWAESTDRIWVFTTPANKDEAVLLGHAFLAAQKRLGVPIRNEDLNATQRAFPEAFAEPSEPAVPPLPEKICRLIWNSEADIPKNGKIVSLEAGPSECGGKLWSVLLWRDATDRAQLSLLGADLVTGAQTLSEIPLPQRERFERTTVYGNVTISTPQTLVINERYLLAGPLDIWKKGTKTNEEKVWLILDRQRGTWKECRGAPWQQLFNEPSPVVVGR